MKYIKTEKQKAIEEIKNEREHCMCYKSGLSVGKLFADKCTLSPTCKKQKNIRFTSTGEFYGIVKCNGSGKIKKGIEKCSRPYMLP